MTRFTLTVMPDGHALLSTPDDLGPDEAKTIMQQFEEWQATPQGIAILTRATVQHATSVDIDLPMEAA